MTEYLRSAGYQFVVIFIIETSNKQCAFFLSVVFFKKDISYYKWYFSKQTLYRFWDDCIDYVGVTA